jgi:hypothetical protein
MALETYPDPTKPYPTRGTLWRPNMSGPRRIDTSLLQACRAVYIETWALPVMQTTLVIHEGSAEDLPQPKLQRQERLYRRAGQPIFFLQAWQVLLLRHIEVTFQQIRLEDNGLEDWLCRVDGARRQSRSLVRELADEAQAAGDDGAAKDFVETSLLGVEIRSLTMRMNRRDWWTWTNSPPPPDADLDWEAKRGYILRLQRPVSPHAVSTHGSEHEEDMKFLSDDLTFTLTLDTFGPKLNQLMRVIEVAKEWTFETSLQQPGSGGANRLMVWDGHIGDQS